MDDNKNITFNKFLTALPDVSRHYGWRYGQSLFNLLLAVRPNLAEVIRATPIDPFYADEADDIDPEVWELLESRWDEVV